MGSSVELAAVLTPSVIEEIDCRETYRFVTKGKKTKQKRNDVSNIITLASDMQP